MALAKNLRRSRGQEPETVRAVVTALLLPMALWVITRVLERLGF